VLPAEAIKPGFAASELGTSEGVAKTAPVSCAIPLGGTKRLQSGSGLGPKAPAYTNHLLLSHAGADA
jgi:hypothetical protein